MIVTVEELQDYMSGATLNAGQRRSAEIILAGVQGEIETYLNRPIEVREFVETLYADASGYVEPSVTPVVAVTAVSSDGISITHTVESPLVYVSYYSPVVVTYTAGLDGPRIPHLRLEVLRIASREMTARHDDTMSVAALDSRLPDAPVTALTLDDERRLDRWRRRVVI